MISPSEAPSDEAVLPARLFQHEPQGRKEVSRLEFHSAKQPVVEVMAAVESRSESVATEQVTAKVVSRPLADRVSA